MTVDQQAPNLPQALARAAAACYSLDESIAKAHRIICDLELLKQQSAQLLGHDPTTLQTLGAGQGGVPGGSRLVKAAVAADAAAAVKQEATGPGQAVQWPRLDVSTAAAAAQKEPGGLARGLGRSCGGARVATAAAAAKLPNLAEPQPGQQSQNTQSGALMHGSAAAGAGGKPLLPSVRTGRPAATTAAPGAPAAGPVASPRKVASPGAAAGSPRPGSMGRFRLATTASGKVKLTPLQALKRKAAASAAEQPAQPVQPQRQQQEGVPARQQAQAQQQPLARGEPQQQPEQGEQNQQQPSRQGLQQEQHPRSGLLHARPQKNAAAASRQATRPEAGATGSEQLLQGRKQEQHLQRPPLPPHHRKRPQEQKQPPQQPQQQPTPGQQQQSLQQQQQRELQAQRQLPPPLQQHQQAALMLCKQPLDLASGPQQKQEQQVQGCLDEPAAAEPCSSAEQNQGSSMAGEQSEEDEPLEARRQRMRAPPAAKQQQSPPEPASLAASGTAASSEGGGSIAGSRAASGELQERPAELLAQPAPAESDSVQGMQADGEALAGALAGSGPGCLGGMPVAVCGSSSASSSSGEDEEELMPLAKRRRLLHQARLGERHAAALAAGQQHPAAASAAAMRHSCEPAALPRQQLAGAAGQGEGQPPAVAPDRAATPAAAEGNAHPPSQEEASMLHAQEPQAALHPAAQPAEQQPAQPQAVEAWQRGRSPSPEVEDITPQVQQSAPAAPVPQPEVVVLLDDSSESGGRSNGSDIEEVVQPEDGAQQPVAGTQAAVPAQPAGGQAAQQRDADCAPPSGHQLAGDQRHGPAVQQPWAGKLGGPGTSGAVSKWYAVAIGRRPGLYTRWTACAGQVLGFRGAEYKSFSSQQAARQYLQQRGIDPDAQAGAAATAAAETAHRAAAAAVPAEPGAADVAGQQQPQAAEGSRGGSPPADEAVHGSGPSSRGPSPSGFAADGEEDSSGGPSEEADAEGEEEEMEEGDEAGGSGSGSGGADSAPAGRRGAAAATGAAAGAAGFHFQDPEAARQFRQSFAAPSAGRKGRLAGVKRRSKAGAAGAAPAVKKRAASPGEKVAQQAWDAFARAWREKNKPSGAEIKRAARDAAAAAAAAAATREMRTPMERLARERAAQQADAARASAAQRSAARRRIAGGALALPPPLPAAADPEDRRMHYRRACQRKVAGITNFVEILRAFNVPTHPSKLKDAYRLAVRMYHPDSNSKEKVWSTEEQKMEAEEVMKVINERKPEDL